MTESTASPTNKPKQPLPPSLILHATDMSEEMRHSAILIADSSFKSPVTHGKVYERIADLIRVEFGRLVDGKSNKEGSSGGWCCVVGGAFGSCITHRMKTYIHFSVVPGVNVLLWKS